MKKLALLVLLATNATAVPTEVTVHVIAKDAKAIYDVVGGAWVTITDQKTGKVLAEGLHTGKSAGSTQKIMIEPHKRGDTIFATPNTAFFRTTLDLEAPTVVEIKAAGPMDYPQAKRTASKTLLLVPGEHITGDGVVLEIHGLIVEAEAGNGEVSARVRMACSCPIEPGGIWNADEFDVTAALLNSGGEIIATVPMAWESGRWKTSSPQLANAASVRVLAGHTPTANFGMHTIDLQ